MPNIPPMGFDAQSGWVGAVSHMSEADLVVTLTEGIAGPNHRASLERLLCHTLGGQYVGGGEGRGEG